MLISLYSCERGRKLLSQLHCRCRRHLRRYRRQGERVLVSPARAPPPLHHSSVLTGRLQLPARDGEQRYHRCGLRQLGHRRGVSLCHKSWILTLTVSSVGPLPRDHWPGLRGHPYRAGRRHLPGHRRYCRDDRRPHLGEQPQREQRVLEHPPRRGMWH